MYDAKEEFKKFLINNKNSIKECFSKSGISFEDYLIEASNFEKFIKSAVSYLAFNTDIEKNTLLKEGKVQLKEEVNFYDPPIFNEKFKICFDFKIYLKEIESV